MFLRYHVIKTFDTLGSILKMLGDEKGIGTKLKQITSAYKEVQTLVNLGPSQNIWLATTINS